MDFKLKVFIIIGLTALLCFALFRIEKVTALAVDYTSNEKITLGSKGSNVAALQTKLNQLILECTKANQQLYCKYDQESEMEEVIPLEVDGVMGKSTLCALKVITGKIAINTNEIDSLKIAVTTNSQIGESIKWE